MNTFTACVSDDTEFKVRYCYTPAEPMTHDHPGCDAEVEIIAVDFGKGWEPLENYPQLNLQALIDDAFEDHADSVGREECDRLDYLRNQTKESQ